MCSAPYTDCVYKFNYDDRSVDELKDVVVHAVCSENPEGVYRLRTRADYSRDMFTDGHTTIYSYTEDLE